MASDPPACIVSITEGISQFEVPFVNSGTRTITTQSLLLNEPARKWISLWLPTTLLASGRLRSPEGVAVQCLQRRSWFSATLPPASRQMRAATFSKGMDLFLSTPALGHAALWSPLASSLPLHLHALAAKCKSNRKRLSSRTLNSPGGICKSHKHSFSQHTVTTEKVCNKKNGSMVI